MTRKAFARRARIFRSRNKAAVALWAIALFAGAQNAEASSGKSVASYDVIIRGGTIYDGSGAEPKVGDVGIIGGRIVHVGARLKARAASEVDARGMAVAPGFINMLSWSVESLVNDPRGLSEIAQGVTLQVFGEGWSMGPLNPTMKTRFGIMFPSGNLTPEWTTLGEYLEFLQKRGVATNVASFVGATTVRIHELGEGDVDPDLAQLARMRGLVRSAMEEGALGLGSSLIYAPASYAETPELTALASEASRCGGMYISHIRSEGDRIEEAVDELVTIARDANVRSEIYHLKMAGTGNWGKLDSIIAKIGTAQAAGLSVTADMYPYTAGNTALAASIPNWAHDGGLDTLLQRLRDPATRARILQEMRAPGIGWENLYFLSGAQGVQIQYVANDSLRGFLGKTVAEIAHESGNSPEQTLIDIVLADKGATQALYFIASDNNIRRQVTLPYMSFGSDAEAVAPEGIALKSPIHPRSYGTFARILGQYVRAERLLSLSEAIHRMTSLPAANLRLRNRGLLRNGYHADLVVFNPATIADRATFAQPHQLAVGMRDVFVNGIAVMRDGQHTRTVPGQVVRGPGWVGWSEGGKCKESANSIDTQSK